MPKKIWIRERIMQFRYLEAVETTSASAHYVEKDHHKSEVVRFEMEKIDIDKSDWREPTRIEAVLMQGRMTENAND